LGLNKVDSMPLVIQFFRYTFSWVLSTTGFEHRCQASAMPPNGT
jgi:hypothetical protein